MFPKNPPCALLRALGLRSVQSSHQLVFSILVCLALPPKLWLFPGTSASRGCLMDNSTTWALELGSEGLGFWERCTSLCYQRGSHRNIWEKRVRFASEGVFSQVRSHCRVGGTEPSSTRCLMRYHQSPGTFRASTILTPKNPGFSKSLDEEKHCLSCFGCI